VPLPFPNVPNLPGVPQIPRSALFPPTPVPQLDPTQSDALWQSASQGPVWGIFDSNNNQVVTPDNVMDFDYRQEYRIPNFPIQGGQLASYDKVTLPYETVVRMSKGGTQQDRTDFLNSIATVAASLDLYVIATPEKIYGNANVLRYELIRRGREGAFFLEVDIFFVEIRGVTAQYSATATNTQNAQQPSALPTVNQGTVQPQPVTPDVVNGLYNPANQVSSQLSSPPTMMATLTDAASQTFSSTFNGQNVQISLNTQTTGMYFSLSMGGNAIVQAKACVNTALLINQDYSGFQGDFAFVDTQGQTAPSFQGLGSRYQLVYLAPGNFS